MHTAVRLAPCAAGRLDCKAVGGGQAGGQEGGQRRGGRGGGGDGDSGSGGGGGRGGAPMQPSSQL